MATRCRRRPTSSCGHLRAKSATFGDRGRAEDGPVELPLTSPAAPTLGESQPASENERQGADDPAAQQRAAAVAANDAAFEALKAHRAECPRCSAGTPCGEVDRLARGLKARWDELQAASLDGGDEAKEPRPDREPGDDDESLEPGPTTEKGPECAW